MRRGGRNHLGVQFSQQIERTTSLAIRPAATTRRPPESLQDGLLGHVFDVFVARQRLPIESLSKVSLQATLVRQEPRLHALDHKVDMVVCCTDGPAPSVSLLQVRPCAGSVCNPFLAVYKQDDDLLVARRGQGVAELVVGVVPAAAGHDARHPATQASLPKEFGKPLAATRPQFSRVAAAFHKNSYPYHRFPPISPLLHS